MYYTHTQTQLVGAILNPSTWYEICDDLKKGTFTSVSMMRRQGIIRVGFFSRGATQGVREVHQRLG